MKRNFYFIFVCFLFASLFYACKHNHNKETKSENSEQKNAIAKAISIVLTQDGKIMDITPQFSPDVFEYNAEVACTAHEFKFECTPADNNATVAQTIYEPKVFEKTPGAEQKLSITITAEDGKTKCTYSIKLKRAKKSSEKGIDNISIYGMKAKFISGTNYEAGVPFLSKSEDIKNNIQVECVHPYAKAVVSEENSTPLGNTAGAKKAFKILVTAEDDTSTQYTLTVQRLSSKTRLKKISVRFLENKDTFVFDLNNRTFEIEAEYTDSDILILTQREHPVTFDIIQPPSDTKKIEAIKEIIKKTEPEFDNEPFIYFPINGANFEYNAAIVLQSDGFDEKYSFKIKRKPPKEFELKTVMDAPAVVPCNNMESSSLAKDIGHDINKYPYFYGAFLDNRNITLKPFQAANYETPYYLWREVYMWAIENGYKFLHAGAPGGTAADLPPDPDTPQPDESLKPLPIPQEVNADGSPIPLGFDNAIIAERKYHPVGNIAWIDCVVWCNAYSEKEHLEPVYYKDGEVLKDATYYEECTKDYGANGGLQTEKIYGGINKIKMKKEKNGYRLPTEAEWEFAARGGDASQPDWWYYYSGFQRTYEKDGNTYSGQEKVGNVGNYKSIEVGLLLPNRIGLYDMTGNAHEFCWDMNPPDSLFIYNKLDTEGKEKIAPLTDANLNEDGFSINWTNEHPTLWLYRIYRGSSWDGTLGAQNMQPITARGTATNNGSAEFFYGFRVVRTK